MNWLALDKSEIKMPLEHYKKIIEQFEQKENEISELEDTITDKLKNYKYIVIPRIDSSGRLSICDYQQIYFTNNIDLESIISTLIIENKKLKSEIDDLKSQKWHRQTEREKRKENKKRHRK